jgi:hypothetical protein
MQPTMPIWTDTARFSLSIENHPTLRAIARLIKYVSRFILTNLHAFAPGK